MPVPVPGVMPEPEWRRIRRRNTGADDHESSKEQLHHGAPAADMTAIIKGRTGVARRPSAGRYRWALFPDFAADDVRKGSARVTV